MWGCAIPLFVLGVAAILRAKGALLFGVQLFAGFCLIANGAYLAVGKLTVSATRAICCAAACLVGY